MKVFLDVGAHVGETLRAARDPRWGFDRIFCFEPDAGSVAVLSRVRDSRVVVVASGLWNQTCERPLYNAGDVGATIFEDKSPTHDPTSSKTSMVSLIRASEWFNANLSPEDDVYLKLNCEGAECDVLDDLIDSGAIKQVRAAMILFDVRKIPSLSHREKEVRGRLEKLRVPYVGKKDVRGPNHSARVLTWLERVSGNNARGLGPVEIARSLAIRFRWRAMPALLQNLKIGRVAQRVLSKDAYRQLRRWFSGYEW